MTHISFVSLLISQTLLTYFISSSHLSQHGTSLCLLFHSIRIKAHFDSGDAVELFRISPQLHPFCKWCYYINCNHLRCDPFAQVHHVDFKVRWLSAPQNHASCWLWVYCKINPANSFICPTKEGQWIIYPLTAEVLNLFNVIEPFGNEVSPILWTPSWRNVFNT